MNVYDFDETIFFGDSEDRFFAFMFKRKGYFWYKVNFNIQELLVKCNLKRKTEARESQYSFLKKIHRQDNLDKIMNEYWDEVEKYMMPWYSKVKKSDDCIATGTPGFVMEPIMKRLGLKNLVATKMDPTTGKISGKFAVQEYKLQYFKEQFGKENIDNFYSDAWSDHFLADEAKHAFLMYDGENRMDWDEYFKQHPEKKKMPYRV